MAIRRLTVIQEPTGEDAEAAARPAWHWVLIGSGLLVTIWAPLVTIALALARKIAGSSALGQSLALALVSGSFALAALTAGYLVGRFGRRTHRRHALLAGVAAALEIWLLVLVAGAFPMPAVAVSAFLALVLLGGGFSAAGSWLSRRAQRNSAPVREP